MYVAFLSYFLSNLYHSSSFRELLSVVASPEAVLYDEDEEKQETTDQSGGAEAHERTSNLILEAREAARARTVSGRILGPVEGCDVANTCAVIFDLEKVYPVH